MSNIDNSNVPVLRFREFSRSWKVKEIGEIGYFYYGKSAPKWSVSEDAPTPCIRYGELYSKFNGIIDKVYSYTNIERKKLKFSKGGEILVPRVGENPLQFANCSLLTLSNVAIGEMISVFNTDENSLFITFYFNSVCKYKFARVVEGGNVSNLYYRYLEKIQVKLPKLPEQTKIATFLTSIDKRLEQLRERHSLLLDYKKGSLQQIFSQQIRFKNDDGEDFEEWTERRLGDFIDIISGVPLKKNEISEKKEGIKILRGINITEGYIRHNENIDRYYNGDLKRVEKFLIKTEDIVLGMDGSKVGKNVSMVSEFDNHSILIQRVARIRSKNNSDIRFIYQILYSPFFTKYVDKVNTSSGIPHISLRQIREFNFKFPEKAEQQKIANFLTSIDKKLSTVSEQIEQLEAYKRGLLQQMFV